MTSLPKTYRPATILARFPDLIAAESWRRGGCSVPPFQSLNLGLHTADDATAVQTNRQRFFNELNIPHDRIVGAHQVHGSKVLYVDQAGQYEACDGFITDQRQLFLTITVADCLPVLLYDQRLKRLGAVHAGWRGTVAGITAICLDQMIAMGSRAEDCYAWLGTCIDECSFEVDQDVADHFDPSFKRWDEAKQKFFIDLKAANRQQLLDRHLPIHQIGQSPYSTYLHNKDYFSYRKEKGSCGRMLAVIGMR